MFAIGEKIVKTFIEYICKPVSFRSLTYPLA